MVKKNDRNFQEQAISAKLRHFIGSCNHGNSLIST